MYRERNICLIEPERSESKAVLKSFRVDTAWKLHRSLTRLRPVLVHAVGTLADYHAKLALMGSKIPLITNVNSEKWAWERHMHRRLLHGLLVPRSSLFLCVSHVTEASLHRLFPSTMGRTVVIHSGIGTTHMCLPQDYDRAAWRARLGYPETAFVFGGFGRLHHFKGFDLLVRAFAHVKHIFPKAFLAIAGWGPQEPELRRMANQLGIRESVRFLGRIQPDRIAPIFATYDAHVVPTRQAGFDNTALEGVYMGLPSVVSEHSGLGEALADSEEVLVVPPDEKSMSEAMLRLIGDPDLRARLASAGRQKVQQKLTIESYAEKIEHLYDQVIATAAR